MPNVDLLTTQLWELRTQLEMQLRSLTESQKMVAELPRLSTSRLAGHVAHIHGDLYEIALTASVVSDSARRAREALDHVAE